MVALRRKRHKIVLIATNASISPSRRQILDFFNFLIFFCLHLAVGIYILCVLQWCKKQGIPTNIFCYRWYFRSEG